MRKRILLALAGAAVAIAAAATWLVNAEQFRPTLESQLGKVLARPVQFGRLSHSIFPLSLRAEALTVGEDPKFGNTGRFLAAKEIVLRVKVWPLLSRRVEIESVRIVEPSIELIRRNGVWNYESVGGQPQQQSGPASASSQVRLGSIEVMGGQAAVTIDGEPRVVYPKVDFTAADLAPGQARLELQAAGTAGDVTGSLSGEAAMKDGAIKGSLSLREGRIRQAAVGNADAKFDLTSRDGNTDVRSFELLLGKLAFRAEGSIRGKELDLKLTAPRAPVADLVRLAAAFGQGLPPGLSVDGMVEADLNVRGSMSEPQVTGKISARNLNLAGGEIKQPVRTGAVTIDLLPESIRSSPFEIECGRTKLSGYFSVRDYAAKPLLESALMAEQSELADLLQIAQAYGAVDAGLRGSGKTTLRLRVHGPVANGATLQLAGKGNLDGVTLQWPSLTQPLRIDRARISFAQDSASVEDLSLKVGATSMSGKVDISNFAAPRIQFALSAGEVNTDEMTKLMRPATAHAASKPARATADGTVAIGSLKFNPFVLSAVRATASFRDGVLKLDPMTTNLYGGSASGRITVDTRGANPAIALDTRLEKIESAQLLAAIGGLPRIISGPLRADVKLSLSPKPNEEPLRSMNGNVALKFQGGKLHTLNLLGELNSIARFLYGPKGEEKFTSFAGMQGDLTLENGTARTQSLKFDLEDATATFSGGMNFADQTLNMKLVSVLSRKLSESVGGNKIGGWMSAAVQNANGELIIPTIVSGTFSQPRLAPDAQAMAKLKLQTTLPSAPAVIDAVKGGREGLKGVFDILKGGIPKKK